MLKLNSKLLAGATAALFCAMIAPAQAQITPLFAGGSPVPQRVYRDIFNCYGNQAYGDLAVGLSWPFNNCSGFTPYRSDVEVLYLGVTLGRGKLAWVNHDSSRFTDNATTPSAVPVASTVDFGPFYGTGTGASWVPDTMDSGPFFWNVSFVGHDNPLTASDLTTYNANSAAGGWGAPIQVPTMIGTVAISFHQTAGWLEKGAIITGASSRVQFSTPTWCGIYTGAITDWSDPEITADNAGYQLGSGPITVVYRNDGNGTTFIFVNALINQCAATSHPVPASWQTAPGNVSGVSNNGWFIRVKDAGLLPASFVGATGNDGVKAYVNAFVGAVGYNNQDFIQPVDPAGPKAANLQTWHSFITPGVTKKFIAPGPKGGTAIMAALKPPTFTPASGFGSCDAAHSTGVAPRIQSSDGICAHNPLNWGVTNPTPLYTSAYPIGGFSFIDTYTCFASADDVNALVNTTYGAMGLLRWYFGSSTENASKVKSTLNAHGFGLLPSSWIAAAKKLLVTDIKTKVSTPGTANTGCATVAGDGA